MFFGFFRVYSMVFSMGFLWAVRRASGPPYDARLACSSRTRRKGEKVKKETGTRGPRVLPTGPRALPTRRAFHQMDARRARSVPARTLAICREGLGGRLRFRSPPPWRIKRARRRRNVFENRVIYPLLHGFLFAGIRRRYATDALFSAHFLHFHCTFSTASATSAFLLFTHILPYFTPVCQSRCASGLGDGICFHDAHCGISDWWLNRQAAKKQTLPL